MKRMYKLFWISIIIVEFGYSRIVLDDKIINENVNEGSMEII